MKSVDSTTIETVTTVLPKILKNVSQLSFSWYDYILFCVMLGLSAMIGIYFGCFGSKQSSADEYLMGNKKMKVFPISVSLVASHVSGLTLLAVPADVYRYGAAYWLFVPGLLITTFCTMYIFLPVFYKLQLTSTYEYLERRFDNNCRMLASFLFTLGIFLYLPLVIYIPALALSAATGISIHYITPVVCGVCIFYTTLGGLKAVVWTDTLQFIITIGAVLTVFIIGIKSAGGVGAVWFKAVEGHRLDLLDFDPDPTKRDSFWIVIIGISMAWLSGSGIHQSCVQKFLSVATYREAKLSVVFFSIGIALVGSFSVFIGLIMYVRYSDCDPFTTGTVQKNDQLLPYYIMDVASHIPGLPGLFIAGIFCAALSTLSASLNCLAGTLFEDFILKITGPIKNEKTTAFILKMIVIVAGVICTALVFVMEKLGGLLPLAMSLGSITSGPLLGMFTLGVLLPKASSKGTFYGAISSLLFLSWVVTMANYYKAQGVIPDVPKPTSTAGCRAVTSPASLSTPFSTTLPSFENSTGEVDVLLANLRSANVLLGKKGELHTNVTAQEKTEEYKPFFLFRISFYYYTFFGAVLTIIFGLILSYLLGNDDPHVHRDLLSPVIYFLLSDETVIDEKSKDYYSLDKALHLVTVNSEKQDNEDIKA